MRFDFGTFKGKKHSEIMVSAPAYISWLFDNEFKLEYAHISLRDIKKKIEYFDHLPFVEKCSYCDNKADLLVKPFKPLYLCNECYQQFEAHRYPIRTYRQALEYKPRHKKYGKLINQQMIMAGLIRGKGFNEKNGLRIDDLFGSRNLKSRTLFD